MAIYKARGDPREKVVFLFSVNGSKKFCGLAEMCGSWDPLGIIHGWKENDGGAKVYGYDTARHRHVNTTDNRAEQSR